MAMNDRRSGRQAGMTLLELLIAVVIVSILAAIIYPSYQAYVVRSNRAVGKAALLDAAARQEQYFANNAKYGSGMTQLGYPANPDPIDRKGGHTATNSIYLISVTNPGSAPTRSYTLTAKPQNYQTRDTKCGNLSLTHLGVKGATGTDPRCWE